MAKKMLDKIYGCLIAGAIGDALGAPIECKSYTWIRENYGKLTELIPSTFGNTDFEGKPGKAGYFTDDTIMKYYLCLAVIESGGRILPEDFSKHVWLNKKSRLYKENFFWFTERIVGLKLKAGVSPWEAGQGNVPGSSGMMGIMPVGIINAGDPKQAYQDAFNIASVHCWGVNRDGAATYAAGIAEALKPDATLQSVTDTMLEYSSYLIRRWLEIGIRVAKESKDADDFVEKYYDRYLDISCPPVVSRVDDPTWTTSFESTEQLAVTIGLLHVCKGETEQSLIEGANFGRDCDSISAFAGGIAGAINGSVGIRQDWIDTVESANESFYEEISGDRKANFKYIAEKLEEALGKERDKYQERAVYLSSLLS